MTGQICYAIVEFVATWVFEAEYATSLQMAVEIISSVTVFTAFRAVVLIASDSMLSVHVPQHMAYLACMLDRHNGFQLELVKHIPSLRRLKTD